MVRNQERGRAKDSTEGRHGVNQIKSNQESKMVRTMTDLESSSCTRPGCRTDDPQPSQSRAVRSFAEKAARRQETRQRGLEP